MKTVSTQFLEEQVKAGILKNTVDKVVLFQQFSGEIETVSSGTMIYVAGDASSLLSVNDKIICPLSSFTLEFTISTVTVIGSQTRIVGTPSIFTSSDIGKTIAKRINITRRILSNGFGDVIQQVEGRTLLEFNSGEMKVSVNNSDGFFRNENGDGIFDSGDIFWGKFFTTFKNPAATDVLYLGGILDLTELKPDYKNRSLTFSIFGHMKELERFPAYYLSDTDGEFVKIGGLKIKSFEESVNTEPGVKNFYYKIFERTKLASAVSIKQISKDIDEGLKILEFRYPNYFRFDKGAWKTIGDTSDVDSNGDAKLYANGGSGNVKYALVNFGSSSGLNEFPDQDEEIIVSNIKEKGKSNIINVQSSNQPYYRRAGGAVVRYDNGDEIVLKPYFQRILIYEDSGGTYTDEVADLSSALEDSVTVLSATADSIIIVAPERFWGIKFIFDTPYGSGVTLEIKYSVGGESFSSAMSSGSNGLLDETNGFENDGDITWSSAQAWRENNIQASSTVSYKGFMIQIKRTDGASGCDIDEISRIIRCKGQDGDFLSLKTELDKLTSENVEEEIVIKYVSGEYVPATWKQNIPAKKILTDLLDESGYSSSKRELSDLQVAQSTNRLNIFGKPPKYIYDKYPSAVYYDNTGDYIYVGIGNELWRVADETEFELLAEFITTDYSILKYQEIIRIERNGTEIHCFVRGKYSDYSRDLEVSCSHVVYDLSDGSITYNNDTFTPCEFFSVSGVQYDDGGGNYYRQIGMEYTGSVTFQSVGENVIIPFKQIITIRDIGYATYLHPRTGLFDTDGGGGSGYDWIFQSTEGEKSGEYFNALKSFFMCEFSDSLGGLPSIGLRYTHGQQGVLLWINNEYWYFTNGDSTPDADGVSEWNFTNKDGDTDWPIKILEENDLPTSACYYNSEIFISFVSWNNSLTVAASYSYITKFSPTKARDWTKVFFYDDFTGTFSDVTDDMNSSGAGIIMNDADVFYFGSDKKFLAFELNITADDLVATLVLEYWDGSSWTEFDSYDFSTGTGRGYVSMPVDWTDEDIDTIESISQDSTDRFWMRLRISSYTSGSITVDHGYNIWTILFDSELDNSAVYYGATILSLCYNEDEDTIHGCLFDRDEDSATGFEYLYFVYDVTNEIMYTSQTGDDFTFNPTIMIRNFKYNSYDDKVYSVLEDVRYNDESSFLISAVFSAGIITLSKVTDISVDWGSSSNLSVRTSDGSVYGITKGDRYYLWQYGMNFHPRIEYAKFSDSENFRDVMNYLAEIFNCYPFIQSNRYFTFIKRDEYRGTISLKWNEHLIKGRDDFGYWDHYYDAVLVNFENFLDEEWKGSRKQGYSGWLKKILSISNPLIQTPYLADIVKSELYDFFSVYRLMIQKRKIGYVTQLECLDRFNIIMPTNVMDISSSTYFLIMKLILSQKDKNMFVNGLEIK